MVNWQHLLQTIFSTALLVSAAAWVAKRVLTHYFDNARKRYDSELEKDLESLKVRLEADNAKTLTEVKANLERQMLEDKHQAELEVERFRRQLESETTMAERIRIEVVRWANPILDAVTTLEKRLDNILKNGGHTVLDKERAKEVDENWSITFDYFFPSTLYLFAQYFCWVRMMLERFSFEVFESERHQKIFFEAIYKVSNAMGAFPPRYEGKGTDVQVFNLQQRAIGEMLWLEKGGQPACMGYHEFLINYQLEPFQARLKPLASLLAGVAPDQRRWQRLKFVRERLADLRLQCERVLDLEPNGSDSLS